MGILMKNDEPYGSLGVVQPTDMKGATSSKAGEHGLVPAPTTSDKDKFLKGDGTWSKELPNVTSSDKNKFLKVNNSGIWEAGATNADKTATWGQISGTLANQTDLKNNLNSLQGQIDSFTALTPGSTTGDAELTNIRVAANGTTYNTAGDAVRAMDGQFLTQLNAMKTGFDGVTYPSPVEMVQGCDEKLSKGIDGALSKFDEISPEFEERTKTIDSTNIYNNEEDVSGYWISPEGNYQSNEPSIYAKIPVTPGTKYLIGYGVTTIFNASSVGAYLVLDYLGRKIDIIDGVTLEDGGFIDGYPTRYVNIPKNGFYFCLTLKLSTTWDRRSTFYMKHVNQSGGELIGLFGASLPGLYLNGKKWVAVGDSLTEHNLRSDYNYHDYVSAVTGLSVTNMGRSGTGYKRTEDEGYAFYQRILNVPTDANVVTIFGSGNDCNYTAMGFDTFAEALGSPTDSGTSTICGCVNKTIENLYSVLPTVPLGIVTPCPWISYNPANHDNYMDLYSQALIQICKNHGIPCLDLYHCSGLRPWEASYRELVYSKDEGNGVHPNEIGHRILASHFKEFVEELLI